MKLPINPKKLLESDLVEKERLELKKGYDRLFLVYSTIEKRLERFNLRHGFVYENRCVNVQLNTGTKLYFCPFAYYDNSLKHKSKYFILLI